MATELPQKVLYGALLTADPPCFAYPVFCDEGNPHVRFTALSRNRLITCFNQIEGSIEPVTLRRPTQFKVGGKAVHAFAYTSREIEISDRDSLVESLKAKLELGTFDEFPSLKRRVQIYCGVKNVIDTNIEIVSKYSAACPSSIRYFLINDVLRGDIETQIGALARDILAHTRIRVEALDITLEFPKGVAPRLEEEIRQATQRSIERTEILNQFSLIGLQTNPDEKRKLVRDRDFEFPFERSFVNRLAKERRFFVFGETDFIFDHYPDGGPDELGIVDIDEDARTYTMSPLTLAEARSVYMYIPDVDARTYICAFSLAPPPNIRLDAVGNTGELERRLGRLLVQQACPISAILSYIERVDPENRNNLLRYVKVGEKAAPTKIHWPDDEMLFPIVHLYEGDQRLRDVKDALGI